MISSANKAPEPVSEENLVQNSPGPEMAIVVYTPSLARTLPSVFNNEAPESKMETSPTHHAESSGIKKRLRKTHYDQFKTSVVPPGALNRSKITLSTKRKRGRSLADNSSDDTWTDKEESKSSHSDVETQPASAQKPSKNLRSKSKKAVSNPGSSKISEPKHKKSKISLPARSSTSSLTASKEKSSTKTSKHSALSFKKDFKSIFHANRWENFSKRNIWPERNIHESDFSECEKIVYHLISQGLGRTFRGIQPFVWRIVQEFYCNLDLDVKNPDHPEFGKVFVRGQRFKFSPTIINTHLCSHWIDTEEFTPDFSRIISDVTGGVRREWPRGKGFPASQLTVKYAILHKIALRNWLPTSHRTDVNKTMAVLLFKIGNTIAFDIGKFFFDQIVKYAEGKNERSALPFPSLIYNILSSQHSIIRDKEEVFIEKEEIRISYKLLAGLHVNDLNKLYENVSDNVKPSPSVMSSRSIKVLEDMLHFLNHQQAVIEKKKIAVSGLLNDLYGNRPSTKAADKGSKLQEQVKETVVAPNDTNDVPEKIVKKASISRSADAVDDVPEITEQETSVIQIRRKVVRRK